MSGSQNTVQNSADVWIACCHLSGTQCDEQTANRTADGLQISIRACSYKQLSSRCSVMIVRSLSYSLFYALLNTQSRCRCVFVSNFLSAGCMLLLGAPPNLMINVFPCQYMLPLCVCSCVWNREGDRWPSTSCGLWHLLQPASHTTLHCPLTQTPACTNTQSSMSCISVTAVITGLSRSHNLEPQWRDNSQLHCPWCALGVCMLCKH